MHNLTCTELKMALTFSSDQVDKDLDIVAPPNKAEVSGQLRWPYCIDSLLRVKVDSR